MKGFLSLICFLLIASSSWGSIPGFDHYRVILDRKPFGDPPPPPARPTPPQRPPANPIARTIRLTAMMETLDGDLRVGLHDQSQNQSFFLRVGETRHGIELVSASYAERRAVLYRDGETEVLTFETSGRDTSVDQPQRAGNRPTPQSTYEDRRRARREAQEQRRREPPPEPVLTGEALQQHLQDYQMEVIRQGLPPLPIPLTAEMDDQLVREGILPP